MMMPWAAPWIPSMLILYSLIAATAAKRLGLAPTALHLDTTSFHVDGRYNCDEPPSEHVVHITKGYIVEIIVPISTKSCWS